MPLILPLWGIFPLNTLEKWIFRSLEHVKYASIPPSLSPSLPAVHPLSEHQCAALPVCKEHYQVLGPCGSKCGSAPSAPIITSIRTYNVTWPPGDSHSHWSWGSTIATVPSLEIYKVPRRKQPSCSNWAQFWEALMLWAHDLARGEIFRQIRKRSLFFQAASSTHLDPGLQKAAHGHSETPGWLV